MAIVKFGHTWWGERWLQSLDNIDFSNRLPRGQRYARNGSVQDINIDGLKIEALVKGSRPSPYKISFKLWKFTQKEKKQILSIINNSPYYLSQLEARVLPEELYKELMALNIKIFPNSWEELKMKCSCPDWAVPCKHLAAVVYIIANEIDKNPFMVFSLHNFDLLKEIHGQDYSTDNTILDISTLLSKEEQIYNYQKEKLECIDYSRINDNYDSIQRLLTEFPLFYLKKDFKKIFLDSQKKMVKDVKKHIKNLDLIEEPLDIYYSTGEFKLLKGKSRYSGFLKKSKKKLSFSKEEPGALIEYIQNLSVGNPETYPPFLSYLIMVHSFVLKLIEKNSIIPEIYSLNPGKYLIRWIPALFDNKIEEIFNTLQSTMPKAMVKCISGELQIREQLLFLVSFFTSYYFDLFNTIKDVDTEPILKMFFSGDEYKSQRFEEAENAKTINLWLGRFFIRPINLSPVIKIDESKDSDLYKFEILVKEKHQDIKDAIGLDKFLCGEHEEKMPLLRDLNLLSTYLPTVNSYLKKKGTIKISSESFVATWFKALPALQTLGIRTILPKILKESFIPQLTLSFKKKNEQKDSSVVNYTSLKEMLDFEWSLAIGDQFIDANEFRALVKKYKGVVRYHDKYLIITDADLAKIQKQMDKELSLGTLDILKINLGNNYNNIPIQTNKELQGILQNLFKPDKTTTPKGLKATLRHYQEAGFRWLYHNYKIGLGSLIADDMGLGKTLQVITFLLKLKEDGVLSGKKRAIIIVPASLVTNWSREIEKFAPELSSSIYHGSKRILDINSHVIITTYTVVQQDIEELKKVKWLSIIIDEAQNIKTPTASRTKAIKLLKSDIKIAMTGTPVENKLMDYWSILDFIMKNLLGNQSSFKENYASPIERFRDQGQLDSFRRLTAPFILRRMKTDKSIISDLPEKLKLNTYTSLTPVQTALYEELVDSVEDSLNNLEGIERRGIIFKLISGLKQICNHPALYLKEGNSREAELSGKNLYLIELLEKIIFNNEKVIIFTQFVQMGHILIETIEKELGISVPFLHGGCSRIKRDTMVDNFQEDLECPIMIISLKAGGVGLNLTAASHVIHYDLWWNPAVENQATDRAFRIGQTKNVNVHRFITKGTFEEKINDMIESKQELADLSVAQGEKWISSMKTNELKELLQLNRE